MNGIIFTFHSVIYYFIIFGHILIQIFLQFIAGLVKG